MKKIIFALLVLKSFVFSADGVDCSTLPDYYNSKTDLLTAGSTNTTTFYGTYADIYPPSIFCSPTYNSYTAFSSLSISYISTDWYKSTYNRYYSITKDYQCPDGQDIINGVCVVPPTCATGTIWDGLQDICVYDPNTADSDTDGIPDKCDPDYVDYLTLDCDGNGIPNATDPDIDGDGILNGADPTPYGSTSTTPDTPCPSTSLVFTPVKDKGSCSMDNPLFFPVPDGELRYVKYVMWDDCRQSCMASVGICPYGQAIKDGVCVSIKPDDGSCDGNSVCKIISFGVSPYSSCFKVCNCLTTLDPVPSTTNEYFYEEVSCSDNLLENDKTEDLRDNTDVNKTLPTDVLTDSNATADLNLGASFKTALDAYAGAKEATQLDLLTESKIQSLQLVTANSNLKNIEASIENFSAVSTSNQGVINGNLQDIDSGIDTSNALLSDIKDNSEAIKNNLEGKNSDGTEVDNSSSFDSFLAGDEFLTDTQNAFTNISNSFSDLTASIDEGFSYSVPTGTSVATTVNVFGKSITFDISSVLVQLSPIIYYFTYVALFLVALKIIFLAFMVV